MYFVRTPVVCKCLRRRIEQSMYASNQRRVLDTPSIHRLSTFVFDRPDWAVFFSVTADAVNGRSSSTVSITLATPQGWNMSLRPLLCIETSPVTLRKTYAQWLQEKPEKEIARGTKCTFLLPLPIYQPDFVPGPHCGCSLSFAYLSPPLLAFPALPFCTTHPLDPAPVLGSVRESGAAIRHD
ncbi:uncharacterized protein BO88DRAFT_47403 [Aspergillus vadensis CBS 113365]|uniref:Uncharacterized protein n=1 Tax=Aspergillus vadensis (strain CBS 113365 / IMI 142717 / IBT 24658) TaxID=1448311 RepID=A0A319BBP7_ASPVC|nr:hypothetical protein BO88DRAFT_47403 [Aspergillus vadensis CBS 113365]PYH69344.1 hypothetical protein BO88DRAFT_47403 [Aspergillus vadensis CBS 113365]